MQTKLKSPFPWFGGKRKVASVVWQRFGNVSNYVEPFYGSGAVLLGRPHPGRTETVNDKDCYIANFWRAVTADPVALAELCDWPVNEADLHARHRWLVDQTEFREKMMTDPDYFDVTIAARWVWGISQWIGSGWCSRPEWLGRSSAGRAVRGIHTSDYQQRPNLTTVHSLGIKRPNLKRGHGSGIHRIFLDRRTPDLGGNSGATGKGIHRSGLHQKLPTMKRSLGAGVLRTEMKRPILSGGRAGIQRRAIQLPQLSGDGSGNGRGILSATIRDNLIEYMLALQDRLRTVRVCCGDWSRILGPSPTTCIGRTAVFLDPPYSGEADRDPSIYSVDCLQVARDVAKWAREHGDDRMLRIALCGYEGEHKMPKSWDCLAWKSNGGYGNQRKKGRGRANAERERIWFSPHCLKPEEMLL